MFNSIEYKFNIIEYKKIISELKELSLDNNDNLFSELDNIFSKIGNDMQFTALSTFLSIISKKDDEWKYKVITYLLGKYKTIAVKNSELPLFLDSFSDENIKYKLINYLFFDSRTALVHKHDISILDLLKIINGFSNNDIKLELISDLISKGYVFVDSFNVIDLLLEIPHELLLPVLSFLKEYEKSTGRTIIDQNILISFLKANANNNVLKLFDDISSIFEITDEKNFLFDIIDCFHDNILFTFLNHYLLSKYRNIDNDNLPHLIKLIDYFIEQCIVDIDDEDELPSDTNNFEFALDAYIKYYNLNRENFYKFINKFSLRALIYIKSNKVQNIINLSKEQFNKFLNIFDEKNLTLDKNTLNTIVNSLIQYKFFLEDDSIFLFDKMISLLPINGDIDKLRLFNDLLNDMSSIIDVDKILFSYGLNTSSFLDAVIHNEIIVRDILHKLTTVYIAKKREKYYSDNALEFYDNLNLFVRIKRDVSKKAFLRHFTVVTIEDIVKDIPANLLSDNMQKLINDSYALKRIIRFKKGMIRINELSIEEKKYLKTFDLILDVLYDNDIYQLGPIEYNFSYDDYEYYCKRTPNACLLDIISNLDITKIMNYLSDEKLNKHFSDILNKYKLLATCYVFEPISSSFDISFDYNAVSSIINFYKEIYDDLDDDKKITFTKLISYGNLYSSETCKYKYILGDDDYQYIVLNSGNFKAPMAKCIRLDRAVQEVISMYQRKYVSVPSFDKEYKINNNKLRVTVANSTNTINLTLGERTNACMRIGGICNDFSHYALTNTNGFNICFYDNDDKLVSRVTGIRYGNTVILNQLRISLNDEYDEYDLYDALKMACDDIISISKKSEKPIENVLISHTCALHNLFDGPFNFVRIYDNDIINLCNKFSLNYFLPQEECILVSSAIPNTLARIKKYDTYGEYRSVDSKTKEYSFQDASKKASQLHAISDLLMGTSLEELVIYSNNIKYLFASDLFYVGLNEKDEIETFIVHGYENDDYVKSEVDRYSKLILSYKKGKARK